MLSCSIITWCGCVDGLFARLWCGCCWVCRVLGFLVRMFYVLLGLWHWSIVPYHHGCAFLFLCVCVYRNNILE